MHSIWEFLLQTVSVSVVAAVVLIVKRIFSDKLSPGWQYYVWIVLAARVIFPVNLTSYILQPTPLWIEMLKGYVEKSIGSVYSGVYRAISPSGCFPIVSEFPVSITDYLFVIYILGIVFVLFRYVFSYARLRGFLKRNSQDIYENTVLVERVCEKYALKSCKVLNIHGISSAFVIGVFRPVIVLPEDGLIDEKVILHELMHLRHNDILQSIFWSCLKALHWCNPFMHYIFGEIANDMEAFCDQRVLEVLEGEERREYGAILLGMANDKYPSIVGTGSISNGGKNISRRIESIVRFKKYPKGMAVVSVCIVLILLSSMLVGTTKVYGLGYYRANITELDEAMAFARVNRCTTVAGAIDTYAKGLLDENGVMIACASSLSKHEMLEWQMRKNNGYHLDSGKELMYVSASEGYKIFNLTMIEDGVYEAVLMFSTDGFDDEESGMLKDENGEYIRHGCVTVPITIKYEDSWVVEERAGRKISTDSLDYLLPSFDFMESIVRIEKQGETGTVSINTYVEYVIENTVQTGGFFNSAYFDSTPKVNASFEYANISDVCKYDINSRTVESVPKHSVGIQFITLDSPDDEAEFSDVVMTGNSAGTSSTGESWACDYVYEGWSGVITTGGGGWAYDYTEEGEAVIPKIYKVRMYWDNKIVEEFVLMEVK